jgi:hypothetical protein
MAQVLMGVRLCCVLYDVKRLCVTYNHVEDDVGFGCHFFVQLVVCHGLSMDTEVFYYV